MKSPEGLIMEEFSYRQHTRYSGGPEMMIIQPFSSYRWNLRWTVLSMAAGDEVNELLVRTDLRRAFLYHICGTLICY